MNKLFLVCGLVLMGITTTPQTENPTTDFDNQMTVENVSLTANEPTLFWSADNEEIAFPFTDNAVISELPDNLDLAEISYLEAEEKIELGFDTKEYLPEDFDPTTFYVDLEAVSYIEANESADLGLSTTDYLPNNFNAYAVPEDFMDVSYMEETEYELGFDTAGYLPERFDPYETELDLNTIIYIEEDVLFETYFECIDF